MNIEFVLFFFLKVKLYLDWHWDTECFISCCFPMLQQRWGWENISFGFGASAGPRGRRRWYVFAGGQVCSRGISTETVSWVWRILLKEKCSLLELLWSASFTKIWDFILEISDDDKQCKISQIRFFTTSNVMRLFKRERGRGGGKGRSGMARQAASWRGRRSWHGKWRRCYRWCRAIEEGERHFCNFCT